jgi:hypothetical protein
LSEAISPARLAFSPKARDIGLVVLTVVAIVLAVLAVKFAGDGPSTPGGAVTVVTSPSASVSPSESPTTAAPSATPTESPNPVTLDRAKAVLATKSSVVISVLGDSTGDDKGEWVDLWAKKLGDSRRVTVHRWDPETNDWRDGAATYGSDGPRVTIWNASVADAKAGSPADGLEAMTPDKADLVLYSFGHDDSASAIAKGLTTTAAAVDKRWTDIPSVVILPNPVANQKRDAQNRTIAAVSRWAKESGTPTIDVAKAFRDSSEEIPTLTKDNGEPSAMGSELWADTVLAALR